MMMEVQLSKALMSIVLTSVLLHLIDLLRQVSVLMHFSAPMTSPV